MKQAMLKWVVLALVMAFTGALAQNGWKAYADMGNRCAVSVPSDWERRQGELFIKDASRQVRMMVMHSRSDLRSNRNQLRDNLSDKSLKLISESGNTVVYRYQGRNETIGAYVGYYGMLSFPDGTCKIHKMIPAELAPMFDDLFIQIAGTLRSK